MRDTSLLRVESDREEISYLSKGLCTVIYTMLWGIVNSMDYKVTQRQ